MDYNPYLYYLHNLYNQWRIKIFKRRKKNSRTIAKRRRPGQEDASFERETKLPKTNSFPNVLPSRDEILEMSSKEFEGRVEQIESSHTLSNREIQEIKVYKRLIKNRESAQASRQKKKQIVRELEQRVNELEEENFKLRRSMSITAAENLALKTEMQQIKNRIQGQVVPQYSGRMPQGPNSLRGVMMMVVLLSFGLLVGNVGFPGLAKGQIEGNTRVFSTEQAQYKPVSNPTILSDILTTNSGQSEHLAERLMKRDSYECELNGTGPLSIEPLNRKFNFRHESIHELRDSSESYESVEERVESPRPNKYSSGDNDKINIKVEDQANGPVSPPTAQCDAVSNSITPVFDWKPNTTYLMCSTMKHIVPPTHITQQFDPENPQNLTFLILPSGKGEEKSQDEKVLEITCLMSSMSVLPLGSVASLKEAAVH